MSRANEELVLRFNHEYINTGDHDVGREFLTQDCLMYANDELEASDAAGYAAMLDAFRIAFPDLDHSTDEILSADDWVVERFTTRGTHLGEFDGIPPTQKRVEFSGTSVFRIRDGRIAEERTSVDLLALMRQLGVIPVPEEALA
jgi:steroid delta-isomerase-like uncharacterized protein